MGTQSGEEQPEPTPGSLFLQTVQKAAMSMGASRKNHRRFKSV